MSVFRKLSAVAMFLIFAGAAVAAPIAFDQPTQPLGDALKQFARTAGVTLSVDSGLVAGKTAPALRQSLEPGVALDRLLQGSGLEAAALPSGGFVIRRAGSGSATESQLPIVPVEAQVVTDPSVDPIQGYRARRSVSATKTDTPLKDVPQSITVITRDAIRDQGMRSMADAVRFVPGMNMAQGEGNRDQVVIRGQNTTSDFFVDGVRDDVQYFRDFYNVERVEAIKGPNALIFGRGGGGGVINRVQKTAGWDALREASVTLGSFDTRRATVDIGEGVNDRVALRLNAMYENSGSYRDYVELERYGVNPAVSLALGPQTMLRLGFEYFHDGRTADRGVPSALGQPFDADSSTFFGNPDISVSDATNNVFNALLEHRLDGDALVRNRTLYGDYDKFYQNVFPSSGVAGGSVDLQAYNNATKRKNFFNQTDLLIDARTGPLVHKLVAGIELARQQTDNLRQTGSFQGFGATLAVPVSAPTIFAPPVSFANNAGSDANNSGTTRIAAAYLQDQVEITPQWSAIAGARFDHFNLDFRNHNTGQDLSRGDNLVSPRLGVIYKPMEPLSLYASYSVSYLPSSGDQFSSLNITTQSLEPEEFTNYEIGAKWDIAPGLAAAAAVFRLDRTNTSAPDPTTPAVTVQTGKERSRGIELGLNGNVTANWQVLGAYAYQEAEIRSPTTAAPVAGLSVPGVPRHTASLWNKYAFTESWSAGLGVIYQSETYASISNTVVLPEFTRVDAAFYYAISRNFRAQLNLVNLLDEKYYAVAHNDNNITPGTTRGAFVNLTAQF